MKFKSLQKKKRAGFTLVEMVIDILELKNKGYINFEPKSQSKGDKFEIKIKVNKDEKTDNVIEELFVLSKGEVFYPKGINSPFSE